ncbi:MAG: SDR family oxidoreductase [Melioribacteraceae bacterium]|nr:SDR family oxidoreductase [Melioribacteraceae bacterium]
MDLQLKDKVVVITGSGQGLGKGIAEAFLKEGAKVTVTDILEERIKDVEKEFNKNYDSKKIHFYFGNLVEQTEIDKCVGSVISKFGKIDVLIANLGSGRGTVDWDIPEEDWNKMLDINFTGARRITSTVLPHMIKNGRGTVTFISSIAGVEIIGAPIHYSVAKAAVIAYAKGLSKKVAVKNIRVNIVCPGNIYFENGTWDHKIKENKQKVMEMLETKVPLKRFAAPEEIANLVAFISSEKMSFMTGSCLILDGGQTVTI